MSTVVPLLITFGSTLGWSVAYAFREEIFTRISPATYGIMASLFYLLIFIVLYFIFKPFQDWSTLAADKRFMMMVGAVLFIEALAIAALFYSISYSGAAFTAFIELIMPVAIAFIAWLAFSRFNFNSYMIIGGLVMLVGAVIATIGRLKL